MKLDISYRANLDTLRRALGFLGLWIALPAGFWHLCETWQRPLELLRIDERLYPLAAVLGACLALFSWPDGWRAGSWRRRAIAGTLCIGSIFAIGKLLTREIAVVELLRHTDVKKGLGILDPLDFDEEGWIDSALEWLDDIGVPVPRHGHDARSQGESHDYIPLWHLLECSRWDVRQRFMRRLMLDEKGADFLLHDWQSLFPAITGQDVTLTRRTAMIEWLDAVARDSSAKSASRDAATFWMGLIVLSDPEAFARWRVNVCDAMLAHDDPPTARTGDVWFRVIDLLLAADSPETQADRTATLTRDPMLLRRALRERVRGLEDHTTALFDILKIEESYTSHHSAMAIWLDLKHLAGRIPESPARGKILNQLRETLADWILMDPASLRSRFINRENFSYISIGADDVVMEIPEATRARLNERAHALLDDFKPSLDRDWGHDLLLPAEIEQVLFIRNFLDEAPRIALSHRLADQMIDSLWIHPDEADPHKSRLPLICGIVGIWDDLDDARKSRFGQLIRTNLPEMIGQPRQHYLIRILCAMRLLHPAIGLQETEWLALSACHRLHGSWRWRATFWWSAQRFDEPRHFSVAVAKSVIRDFQHAMQSNPGSMRFSSGEHAMEFPQSMYAPVIKRARERGSPRDFYLHLLASHDLVSIMDFPDDAPELMAKYQELWSLVLCDPSKPRLSPWLDKPGEFRRLLQNQDKRIDPRAMRMLAAYLAANPPSAAAMDEVLDFYRQLRTHKSREIRIEAHRGLLRMEGFLADAERSHVRESFLAMLHHERPAAKALPLDVSWHVDALSAAFSWQSEIVRATHSAEHFEEWIDEKPSTTQPFHHLAFACDSINYSYRDEWISYSIDSPVPKRAWRTEPRVAVAEPTPWQRARDFSLRHPDLRFPDKMMFRPGTYR